MEGAVSITVPLKLTSHRHLDFMRDKLSSVFCKLGAAAKFPEFSPDGEANLSIECNAKVVPPVMKAVELLTKYAEEYSPSPSPVDDTNSNEDSDSEVPAKKEVAIEHPGYEAELTRIREMCQRDLRPLRVSRIMSAVNLYAVRSYLKTNRKNNHNRRDHSAHCYLCELKEFPGENGMKRHFLMKHLNKIWKLKHTVSVPCFECGQKCADEKAVVEHFLSHGENGEFEYRGRFYRKYTRDVASKKSRTPPSKEENEDSDQEESTLTKRSSESRWSKASSGSPKAINNGSPLTKPCSVTLERCRDPGGYCSQRPVSRPQRRGCSKDLSAAQPIDAIGTNLRAMSDVESGGFSPEFSGGSPTSGIRSGVSRTSGGGGPDSVTVHGNSTIEKVEKIRGSASASEKSNEKLDFKLVSQTPQVLLARVEEDTVNSGGGPGNTGSLRSSPRKSWSKYTTTVVGKSNDSEGILETFTARTPVKRTFEGDRVEQRSKRRKVDFDSESAAEVLVKPSAKAMETTVPSVRKTAEEQPYFRQFKLRHFVVAIPNCNLLLPSTSNVVEPVNTGYDSSDSGWSEANAQNSTKGEECDRQNKANLPKLWERFYLRRPTLPYDEEKQAADNIKGLMAEQVATSWRNQRGRKLVGGKSDKAPVSGFGGYRSAEKKAFAKLDTGFNPPEQDKGKPNVRCVVTLADEEGASVTNQFNPVSGFVDGANGERSRSGSPPNFDILEENSEAESGLTSVQVAGILETLAEVETEDSERTGSGFSGEIILPAVSDPMLNGKRAEPDEERDISGIAESDDFSEKAKNGAIEGEELPAEQEPGFSHLGYEDVFGNDPSDLPENDIAGQTDGSKDENEGETSQMQETGANMAKRGRPRKKKLKSGKTSPTDSSLTLSVSRYAKGRLLDEMASRYGFQKRVRQAENARMPQGLRSAKNLIRWKMPIGIGEEVTSENGQKFRVALGHFCLLCSQIFPTPAGLKRHILRQHFERNSEMYSLKKPERAACFYCRYRNKEPGLVKSHLRTRHFGRKKTMKALWIRTK